eukprot:SAG11_NODE_50_length_19992_cov_9.945157_26_plen_160_part_00
MRTEAGHGQLKPFLAGIEHHRRLHAAGGVVRNPVNCPRKNRPFLGKPSRFYRDVEAKQGLGAARAEQAAAHQRARQMSLQWRSAQVARRARTLMVSATACTWSGSRGNGSFLSSASRSQCTTRSAYRRICKYGCRGPFGVRMQATHSFGAPAFWLFSHR